MYDDLADDDFIQHIHGLYVGQLTDEEIERFDRCVKAGLARRVYEGVGGLMGLAKVEATR